MNRKGQVTIFIIIAVLLIAFAALFLILKDRLGIFAPQSDPVYLFTKDCIEDTGKDAILYITKNGGYLYPITLSTNDGLPYYYYNNQSYLPTKERIADEISAYMEQTLSYCIDDFSDFPGLNITEGEVEVGTTINDEEVVFNARYPITVKNGDIITRFEDFNDIKIIARVGILYNSVEKMIQEQVGKPGICLSCISALAEAGGFTVSMTNTEEGMIFTARDETSKIKDVPIEWNFVNYY